MVQGFAAGYFLWDLAVCAGNVEVHGPGALMHAVSALAVSLLGFVSLLVFMSECFIEKKGGEKGERIERLTKRSQSGHSAITTG